MHKDRTNPQIMQEFYTKIKSQFAITYKELGNNGHKTRIQKLISDLLASEKIRLKPNTIKKYCTTAFDDILKHHPEDQQYILYYMLVALSFQLQIKSNRKHPLLIPLEELIIEAQEKFNIKSEQK